MSEQRPGKGAGTVIPIRMAGSPAAATTPATPADAALLPGAVGAYLAPGKIRLPALPPLALYIHFPWCVRKCPYCDFNSHEHKDGAFPEAAYIEALRQDIELSLPLIWGRKIHSIFIGGGTPSLMSAAGLDALMAHVRALLPMDADAEVTLPDLVPLLTAMKNNGNDDRIVFRGDKAAVWGTTSKVLAELNNAGFHKIAIQMNPN